MHNESSPILNGATTVRFNQEAPPYNAFLNHSPYRILYRRVIYPSALHLLEATKFIDQHPEIGEIIRKIPRISDVFPAADGFQHLKSVDWDIISKQEEVLYLKVEQHPDLRSFLLDTGDAEIIYENTADAYWGSGPQNKGKNEFGKALMRVRERLQRPSTSWLA
ncbi:hypothetical protein CVT26_007032 [Gymnopilus dilepis]|uniref:NADAR domain-containing protein n=1 Tax=Gymnopilus dilepis TaxID=231916 RepID=A0A409VN92_9AGAR|nr:hypothetical protein CVT26_007032 [Gymnopilus dilepis]